MKKKIIFIPLLLFVISFVIVFMFGRQATIEYDINGLKNVSINYDKDIINCKEDKKDEKLVINISPVRSGKTSVVLKGEKGSENSSHEMVEYKKKVYVHITKVITLGNYFGKCNGDILFMISYLIILFVILIYVIMKFIKSVKNNLYAYGNIRLLGLIIFVFIMFSLNLYIFILDMLNNYNDSLYMFILNVKESSFVFMILMLPITFILSLLLFLSNIRLVLKEGKSWKNMFGIILDVFVLFSIFMSMLTYNLSYPIDILHVALNVFSYIISIVIVYFECIFFGTIIIGVVSAKKMPKFNIDYIIILGCKIRKDGSLFPLLKSRVDKAIEFAKIQKEKNGKDIIFVPSGGKGNDEIISEAEAMNNYLIEQGIDKNQILMENKSTNTYDNIKLSYDIISKRNRKANIAFCTTNYHVFRAGNIAFKQNVNMNGIGAKTKTYYWINAFIREYIATLVSEKKKNIKVLIVLVSIGIIMLIISYLSLLL